MKNNDLEKRFGMKLKDAYMKENVGTLMSRDEFHRLIKKAENGKRKRRILTGVAAASVALCLIFGGFVAGMSMRESASAGRDDDTKTVQQGSGVVIGSGVSENDQNVGLSTKTYTKIEDIPEDIRKEIHFLDSDEFELEKATLICSKNLYQFNATYLDSKNRQIAIKEKNTNDNVASTISTEKQWRYRDITVYENICDMEDVYYLFYEDMLISISIEKDIKIEAVLNDLLNLE